MVGDIVEKGSQAAPTPPDQNKAQNAFDRPRKKPSQWKERKRNQTQQQQQKPQQQPSDPIDTQQMSDKEKIHLENLDRISKMSLEEFEQEQEELFANMDVNVLQGLLKRAQAKEGGDDDVVDDQLVDENEQPISQDPPSSQGVEPPENNTETSPHIHFSKPNDDVSSSLDLTDPKFMEKMKNKYFPNLESEPEKMAWMTPVEEKDDQYDPEKDALAPSELRFDFKGNLISPRQARAEDYIGKGLHHHGDAPLSAGYTVAELGHLARSQIPAQRNIAIQTLGRILYRLGKNNYGKEIGAGVWGVIDYSHILDTLYEASESRHLGVQSYATEALWLWRQGGGFRPAV